jgi:hypothetical protein
MRLSLLIFLGLLFSMPANAQKVLQIEKYGSAQTQKIQRGQYLTYKLKGNDSFSVGYIEDIFVEDSLLQLGDRYVNINDIEALRFDRPWASAVGKSLSLFGIGWSGFALIGPLTDDDNDSRYRASDLVVTLTSVASGLLISELFKYKYVKIGKRKKLRLLDLRFKKETWEN